MEMGQRLCLDPAPSLAQNKSLVGLSWELGQESRVRVGVLGCGAFTRHPQAHVGDQTDLPRQLLHTGHPQTSA